MALLLLCPTKDPEPWNEALMRLEPALDLRIWPAIGNPDDIEFAVLWNHPPGTIRSFARLKAISSMGAGIDHLLTDPDIPRHIPIARIVDPALVQSMSEYVVTATLTHFREFGAYRQLQSRHAWQPQLPRRIEDFRVGIMGMGVLGSDAATKLSAIGFSVHGWSLNRKSHPSLRQSFAGSKELSSFLEQTNILICLLPLTSETRGILNQKLLAQLPAQAYLINAARGGHLIEQDLLDALQSNHLSGACLDVFEQEPLPEDHPFWKHPNILVTPHIASITDPASAAEQVLTNYRRAQAGAPLLNAVSLDLEY